MNQSLVLPVIHLNGTSRETLLEQRIDAVIAVRQSIKALQDMAPNGRDYYPVVGLFEKAQEQHRRRVAILEGLLEDLEAEQEALA